VTVSGHVMYDDGVLRITQSGPPPVVALAGEIDEATFPGLLNALDQALDGQSEVHFDLAGVEYCDLAGLRAIICVTGGGPDGRDGWRRVVLHRLPPELQTVLRIVGWDSIPGLTMDECPGASVLPEPDPVIATGAQTEGRQ
jgi:ABC-type transporter Mla MlaB component